jgi:hypothetical protein
MRSIRFNPSRESRRAALVGWLCCTAYAFLQTQIVVMRNPEAPYIMVLLAALISSYLYGILAIGVGRWVRVLFGRGIVVQMAGHIAGALIYALGWYGLYIAIFVAIWGRETLQMTEIAEYSPWMISSACIIYGMIVGIFHSRRYRREAIERALREKDLLLRASRMELAVLKSQMNPHFLFNTLNTVNALVGSSPERARTVIAELADILRYSLDSDRKQLVPLADELRFVEGYLSIEKERFGTRLAIEMSVAEETRELMVPPMLIQPLVENAVRHGILPRESGGSVAIRARRGDDGLMIEIADDGVGTSAGTSELFGNGRGLHNTDQRLRRMFGDGSALEVRAGASGFIVRCRLPAIEPETTHQIQPASHVESIDR